MTSTQDDDKLLVGYYHRRQELLRELNDIDSKIRNLETRLTKKEHAARKPLPVPKPQSEEAPTEANGVVRMSMQDQNGYKEATRIFEDACRIEPEDTPEELEERQAFRNAILADVMKSATELSADPYGNYFMQRIIGLLKAGGTIAAKLEGSSKPGDDESEVITLLDALSSDIPDISCNMHGTRCIQRLIDVLVSADEFELFSDLIANDLVMMIKDLNANHTVLRLLLATNFVQLGVGEDDEELRERGQNIRKDIYHIIATNCVDICVNRQGCCIIQRCLQSAPEPFRSEIINVALSNVLPLVQDPFGNYVIQYILDLQLQAVKDGGEVPNYTNRIIRQMLHHIAPLSCNKFGSNVIEKCLKSASSDVRQLLIDELTDPNSMPKLLTDSFANYVVQTAIVTAADETQFKQLRDAILPLQHLLKNSPYGVKIESKLNKRARDSSKRNNTGNAGGGGGGRKPQQQRGGGGGGRGGSHHQQAPSEGSYQAYSQPQGNSQQGFTALSNFSQQSQLPAPGQGYPQQQSSIQGFTAMQHSNNGQQHAAYSQQQQQHQQWQQPGQQSQGYTAMQRISAQNARQDAHDDPYQLARQAKTTHSPYAVAAHSGRY